MRFTTKTEYGLICLIRMAKAENSRPLTVKEIVRDENFPVAYTEKILQKLRAANIVAAQHGNQGGYVLARPASEIYLKEIVEALEGSTFDVYCKPRLRQDIVCTHFSLCGVKPIWLKTKELLDNFYSTVTLKGLAEEDFPLDRDVTAQNA
ncbi:MAG: Rrf2 family transcriptional regulator [Candidatus Omnitrophica bacterium]|nr:Rrf2 family transcriptional regulator [Candidatus Omnitrophota bacterium]